MKIERMNNAANYKKYRIETGEFIRWPKIIKITKGALK